ncbi:hypothetical protein ABTY53_08065 [Streptomyces noursei]|uniref:hypothetical protein n=1 Tax=Streptomyces noursei TaxID=1971 RepID=UPI00332D9715
MSLSPSYDLRHAGISFWLYSGVDPAECARRAGQSVEVLFRHYAEFLDGVRGQANRLIEQLMKEWGRVSRVWRLGVSRGFGPRLVRNSWSGAGKRWEELGVTT